MRKITFVIAAFLSVWIGFAQGSETFDNATDLPTGTTYGDGSFVGNDGITWNYIHAQSAVNYPIDGEGILFRRANEPSSISATIDGGIGNFSVDTRKAFTGSGQRKLELVINGVVIEQFEPAFPNGGSDTVFPFVVEDINIEGTFTLELRLFGANGNQQIVLDNIEWTGYAPINPCDELEILTTTSDSTCDTGVMTLEATAASTNIYWYTTQTGGTSIHTGGTFTTPNLTTTTSYWVAEFLDVAGVVCESARVEVIATVNPTIAVEAISLDEDICEGSSTTLTATSTNADYVYTWEPGALIGASVSVSPLVTTTYTVTALDPNTGCTTQESVTVVIVSVPDTLTVTASEASVCADTMVTLTAVAPEVSTENITWSPITNLFLDAQATIAYEGTQTATVYMKTSEGGEYTYTATLTVGDCGSISTDVVVEVIETALPIAADQQTFDEGETLADLDVEGTEITWYSDVAGTTELPNTTLLVDGATYYVSQTVDDCESEIVAITVTEELAVADHTIAGFAYYPNPVSNVLFLRANTLIDSVVVYNHIGQSVLDLKLNATEGQVDFSSLPTGAYFIKVASEGKITTNKLIKK